MAQRVRRSKVGAAKHGAVKQCSEAGQQGAHTQNPLTRAALSSLRAPPKCQPLVLWELARDIGAINLPLKLRMSHRADWLLALLAAAHLTLFRTGGCTRWFGMQVLVASPLAHHCHPLTPDHRLLVQRLSPCTSGVFGA